MLVIIDYDKTEYPLLATKIVNSELNGQEDIELTIHQQKNNTLDLKSVDKLWELDYNNITYKIVYVKQQTRGSGFYLNVRATPLFYWDFDKSIMHENNDGSYTANDAFRKVFEGTGYNYVLVDFSPSLEWEGFGKGATRLEMFKRLIDRYGYEFTINGSTVMMRHLVGNDTNFMYKYKLNASNVSKSTDASAMFTHIKGFGNYDEGEEDYYKNAKLKREFTSPLADIVGKWEGKPIVDGRVKQADTLDEMMKEAVESSLDITVEGTLHDIRKMGYDVAVPTKGDRVWLLDERIDLEQEIRVYSVKTTYDERDNIIDCEVTFGSQSIRERHKASINSLSKNFADLLTGQLKLPIISLEKIGRDMINAIHAASSEIIFGDFGMQAISKTNPNHVFGVNSEGWYISQDGGRTPRTIATAEGIYADALFAGTLWLTNDMNIESADGYLNVTGSNFVMRSKTNSNNAVEITPNGITIHGFDGREFIVDGIMRGQQVANIQRFNNPDIVEDRGRDMLTYSREPNNVYAVWDRYKGRYLTISGVTNVAAGGSSTNARIYIRVVEALVGSENVLYEEQKFIDRDLGNPERYSYNIILDLQAFYGSIPDYRQVNLYIQVQGSNNISPSTGFLFRVNRGEFNG